MKKMATFKYPGIRRAMDGNTAVIMCERESSDAAGAYPITPSTQMGEYWAEEASNGHINISERPLIFIEPESEHAAAAVTAGLSMTGLRATNFSSAQGIAFMHESLYAAVGKRLTYVLNIGSRAITKASLNVHCAHDDYHCVDDTGFFQMFAKSAQEAADLNIISHRVAELALTPGIIAQDGFLTTHLIECVRVPERELIAEFLGKPDDIIDTPTPAQRIVYGPKRRRVPAIWDVDNPMVSGSVQNQDAYMQAVAAQRPYFFDHIRELADKAMAEFFDLTGRRYNRVSTYRTEDAEYLIVGQGSVVTTAEAVADYLRETRRIKIGVVNITMFRPFPGDLLGHVLKGKKGVAVLERTDQPLAEDLPLVREARATVGKCLENGIVGKGNLPYPDYAVYSSTKDMPVIYSGSFGLGSRDLQPEGLIGAIENMLPNAARKKFFYLGVEFVHDKPQTPKQEIYQQELLDAYPRIRELAVKGSENPNLMPKGAITVRMHSVGGWGAVTTGKNLAMTLFELLDYEIKANPKYGSEKKGQPTTYYLSAAREPIRVNCEYKYVDVVLSPDPNVFGHSNALSGLRKGGVFIVQSDLETPDAVWLSFPTHAQKYIVENDIRVFYVDAFRIAREEASNPELQFRMQGIAFQGAFFKVSGVMEQAKLTEQTLFNAIRDQLESKFGSKGVRVVEDNVRVVRRGFDEIQEITQKRVGQQTGATRREANLPIMLKQQPESAMSLSDIHRFWEQTGNFYATGQGSDNIADPFIGLSLMPVATGVYRDMTQIRFEHPTFIPENCTACGDCYTTCPDSAIPGLVTSIPDLFNTVIGRMEKTKPTRFLRRSTRTLEKKLRVMLDAMGESADVSGLLDRAIEQAIAEAEGDSDTRERLTKEFELFRQQIGDFKFSITKPYYTNKEKQQKGSGGLFSITVNPYTCKGCMECVAVCDDNALVVERQIPATVARLRKDWAFWLGLPTTPSEYIRIDNLDERIGALETLLLDKRAYDSMTSGDGACLGCGEKTAIHIFTGTVTALMQPRVKAHVKKLDELIERLDKHVRMKLAATVDLSSAAAVGRVIEAHEDKDLTLSRLAARLDEGRPGQPIDSEWLRWVTQLLDKLKDLRWRYTTGVSNRGRSELGIVNATGCTSVWGSTWPYSPYPFPWASHLFQDSPSMAMGLFEGHMTKMAEGFKAIRMAELELRGEYNVEKHKDFFTYFNWKQFSDEEFALCPPVVSIGGDGAMYDIGFQNLSRMMMSGMPIKVLVLDTQVYSNTGGQNCTSGFVGQVADMAPYGKAKKGKQEVRKEISLIGMAHRTSYVLQSSVANVTHMLEGFIEGLNSRRPALFNVYATCQPEHGVADDATFHQTKLALESRAYPMVRFNPDKGTTLRECTDLEGNPALEKDWPIYSLEYVDEDGSKAKLELPLTFADFALTEGRFRKHFKKAPRETWNEQLVPMHEFIELSPDDREGLYPFIWTVDHKQQLGRVLVSAEIVDATLERRSFWRMLKSIVGLDHALVDAEAIAKQARLELAQKLLMLAGGDVNAPMPMVANGHYTNGANGKVNGHNGANGAHHSGHDANGYDYEPVWIETPECTSCDECVIINPNIFVYNDEGKAVIANPRGGPFKDIVRAAEKCTAGCIHPGTPFNPSEADLQKLIKRAEKYH